MRLSSASFFSPTFRITPTTNKSRVACKSYGLGRRSNNLSRTLKTLEAHGLVQLTRKNRAVKPKLRARTLRVELRIG